VDDRRRLNEGFGDVGRGEADAGHSSFDDAPDADGLHLLLMVAGALENIGLPVCLWRWRIGGWSIAAPRGGDSQENHGIVV
jgi:hypothetical protein